MILIFKLWIQIKMKLLRKKMKMITMKVNSRMMKRELS